MKRVTRGAWRRRSNAMNNELLHLLPTHASARAPGTSTFDGKAGHPECMNENENCLPEACGHASNRGSWPRTTSNGPHTMTLQQRDGGEEGGNVAVVSCKGTC
jgi:hypothetical protein